jgi:type I restriction enzyme R subunit
LSYEEYLKKIEMLATEIQPKTSTKYPPDFDTSAKRALFDNLQGNVPLAIDMHDAIDDQRPDNWIGSPVKEKAVRNIIRQVLSNHGIIEENEVSRIYDIVEKQEEFK